MSGAEATGSTSSRDAAAPTVALVAILLILAALFAAPGAGAAIYTLSGDSNAGAAASPATGSTP